MGDFVYSLIGFAIAIGILVTVHEFGHFWVARRLGVKVLRFSIGFGRPLWSRRAGADATEYVSAAIPLGGYVKMLDESDSEVAESERHRAFNRQGLPKRAAIVLAGPFFNFLFAAVAYSAVFAVGVAGIRPVVGGVDADSLAERSGFRSGDEIVAVDARPNRSWDEHRLYLFNKAFQGARVDFDVVREDGARATLELDLAQLEPNQIDAGLLENAVGLRGYVPEIPPVIGRTLPGSPSARAGLQAGDRIVALDGEPVSSWGEVVEGVMARPDQALRLRIDRGGQRLELEIVPEPVEVSGRRIGRIGAEREAVEIPAEMRVNVVSPPLEALWRGVENTWVMSSLTVRMLVKMFQLEVSSKNISGPLTIAQYAGHSAQVGLDRFVLFLAVVSISLGILNLLPIPVLDGGHLLYYVAEAIKGGPLPQSVLAWGQQIGIVLLIGLMTLAFYNDIVRLLQ